MKPIKCSFPGCDNQRHGKGLCPGHYAQQHKGQELRPLRPSSRGLTLDQRFWQKVRKTESCWAWTAATDGKGYGKIWLDGQMRKAHRLSWEFAHGTIPDGMDIDHRCGNRACVRPTHLRVTTRSQNSQHRTVSQRNNTSGVRGVYWNKQMNAWRACASLNGRTYHGGYHSTIEAADKAARALRARLFTHDDHSEWSQRQEKAA